MNLLKNLKRLIGGEIFILVFIVTAAICLYFWPLFSINPALRGTFDYDFYAVTLPSTWYLQYLFHAVGIPLWDPISENGIPIIGESAMGFFYIPQALIGILGPSTIFHTIYALEVVQIFHWYVLCIGTFLFLRKRLKYAFFASIFGSVLMLFNVYILIESMHGHNMHVDTLCWFPFLLFCFTGLVEQKSLRYFVASVIVTYAVIACGYIPIAHLTILIMIIYLAYRYFPLIKTRHIKPFLLPLFALILGIGITAVILLPQFQLAQHSWRLTSPAAYENLQIVSSSPGDILRNIIFPYQFDNSIPFYCGMIAVFLVGLCIYAKKFKRDEIFFMFLAAAIIIISLGETLGPLFGPFFYLPTFGTLRAPSRLQYFTVFSMSVLSASMLSTFIKNPNFAQRISNQFRKVWKYFFLFLIFVGPVLLVVRSFLTPHIGSVFNYFFLQVFVSSASLLAVYLFMKNPRGITTSAVIIIVLVIDVSLVNNTLIKLLKFTELQNNMPTLTATDLYSHKYPLTPRGIYIPSKFYNQSIYDHNFKLNIYGNDTLELYHTDVLLQYNTIPVRTAQGTIPFELDGKTYSRWWIVNKCQFKQNDVEILSSLTTSAIDLQKEILLLKSDLDIARDYCGNQNLSYNLDIVEYKSSSLKMQYSSSENGILYLSETYYPGWKALIDRNPAPIIRGNFAFRAIPIPKGNHTITLWFTSDTFTYGAYISIGSLLVFLIFSLTFWRRTRQKLT
jgi:hypothetical protein